MIKVVNCYSNQYELLIKKPDAWQVLGLESWGLVKNDEIQYTEVTRLNVPTGRSCIGVIKWIGNSDIEVLNSKSTLYYCEAVQRGLGSAVVGFNLIIG